MPHDIEFDVAGGEMYMTDKGSPFPRIYRVEFDGGNLEMIVDFMSRRNNYGRGPGQNLEYSQANTDGSNPVSIVNSNLGTDLDNPMDIVTDGLHLYWTNGGVRSTPLPVRMKK